MISRLVKITLVLAFVAGWGVQCWAKDDAAGPTKELIIGTHVAPPFVMKTQDGGYEGLSIDLWRKVAAKLGIKYKLEETGLDNLVSGVADGKLDASAAALTITANRAEKVDFSHPFYTSGLGIAVKNRGSSEGWLRILGAVFSIQFLKAIVALALVLLAAGFAVWLLERKKNPDQFGGPPARGLGQAFWWSAVTMTTVGYGDKAPATVGGRLVAMVWMFTSVVIISSFTASIASSLTVSSLGGNIHGPKDLPGHTVATVAGSTSENYLKENHLRALVYPKLQDALAAVQKGEADAMVYDAPILKYYVRQRHGLKVLPAVFSQQDYGIALPLHSPLRKKINIAILETVNSSWWTDLNERYVGD